MAKPTRNVSRREPSNALYGIHFTDEVLTISDLGLSIRSRAGWADLQAQRGFVLRGAGRLRMCSRRRRRRAFPPMRRTRGRLRHPLFRAKWEAMVRAAKASIDLETAGAAAHVTIDQAIKISQLNSAKKQQEKLLPDPLVEESAALRERILGKLRRPRDRDMPDRITEGWTFDEEHDQMLPGGCAARIRPGRIKSFRMRVSRERLPIGGGASWINHESRSILRRLGID